MLLNGQLSITISMGDLTTPKKFGHGFPALWATFKGLFPAENLSEFDQMIDELERFESIRYPDEILRRGASIAIGRGRGRPITASTPGRTEPAYQIGMGDVDAFFGRLFPLCGMNPQAYFGLSALCPEGRDAITKENDAYKNWLP